jgi:thioredoxin 1
MNPIPLVTAMDFREKVLEARRPVLVWFTVPNCPPCRKIEPVIVSLYFSHKKDISFFRLDITRDAEIAQDYRVTNTPTLIYFKGGEEVARQDSMPTKREILHLLQGL